MAVERAFLVKLLADTSQMTKAFKDVGQDAEKSFGSAFNKISIAAAAAFAGLATFATKAAFAAAEDAAEQEKLATSLRNVVGASDEAIAATEQFIEQLARTTTFSDSELRPALQSLVVVTGDLGTAQKQLTLAQDVAIGTGRPLAEVADALAKANAGNFKSLQQLSPALRDTIKEGASLDTIFSQLSATFAGQASAAAGTLQGQMTILRNRFAEVVEKIGQAFLPALENLVGLLGGLATFVENNTSLIVFLGTAFAVMTGLIIAAAIAMKIYAVNTAVATAATGLFGTALTATGIGAIVVAIGLLIAAFVTFVQKSESFRNAVKGFINIVLAVVEEVINTLITLNNNLLQVINLIIKAINFLGGDLKEIAPVGEVSFGRLSTAANKTADAIDRIGIATDAATRRLAQANLETGLVGVADATAKLAGATARVDQLRAQALTGKTSIAALTQALKDQSNFQSVLNTLLGDSAKKTGGSSKATTDAIKPLEAYTAVLKEAQSASDNYGDATKKLTDTKKNLKKADEDLAAAQQKLLDAQRAGSPGGIADAQRALAAAERNVTRAKFDQEGSIFSVRNAEKKLAEVRADSKSTTQDIREAEIALEEAKLSVKDTEDNQVDVAKRLETARRDLRIATEGLREGDEELIPIKDAVTKAQEAQTKASEDNTIAINKEAEALKDYRIELDKLATAIIKFPKASTRVGQGGLIELAPPSPEAGNGGGGGQRNLPDKVEITVNSSIVNPLQVAQEIQDYLDQLNRAYGTYAV